MVHIGNDWDEILKEDFNSESYLSLRQFLIEEYKKYTVYPDMHDLFNALKYTSFGDTKVVILGQDPYYNPGQAHGLCFSVKEGVPAPKSLINIFKEINDDVGIQNTSPYLVNWAKQGVLLLNTVMSVRAHEPQSHTGKGWEVLTDSIIKKLSDKSTPVVFLLWGSPARRKKELIDISKNLVLECAHPSPLSAYNGFFGCKHFSKTNEFLQANGMRPIDWRT